MPQQIYANYPLHILTNSTCTNILDFSSTCPVNESDWTVLHADKTPLPPFLLSNMLDLTGDLDLHLGCLRKVQYHLESLFDELLPAVEEAWLAGVLNEDSFKIPTMIFKSRSNASEGLSLASSIDSERRKLSPVYCSHSTRDDSQQPHVEAQVDVVWVQNLHLSSNGSALSSSPSTNSDNYPVSWFCVSPKSRGTGTYIPKVVRTLSMLSYLFVLVLYILLSVDSLSSCFMYYAPTVCYDLYHPFFPSKDKEFLSDTQKVSVKF